ncbi:hypothetical protein RvY_13858 [Ramazzottius varieornatus]|uniref:Uncharacterized protein n=1 Tax=Ramazzottius varieornatus TaxID=947166 RepID=A0A1D1VPD2_RAMVA|nr:hypothetical protein RvY_13858 [Ramazzottius varieornatus]
MNDDTTPSSHHGGKLECAPNPSPFPSMLLLRKRPFEMDQQSKAAEADKIKKRGLAIMDRVKGFLPVMKSSEEELQRRMDTVQSPEQLDIEHVEDGETAVEFNLGLFEYSSDSEDLEAESDVTESSFVSDISDDDECPARKKILESSDLHAPPPPPT